MFFQTQTARWPPRLTLTFKLVRTRAQTRLPCEFDANPFNGSQDISYTKVTAPKKKQNLTQFTAIGYK